jgi:hypothetical protein
MRNPFSRDTFGQPPDPSAYGVSQAAMGAVAPDERVRRALEATDYPYTLTPNHNFNVTLNYTSQGRTQVVYIASGTQTLRDQEWRRVWSWALTVPGSLGWDQALALLDEDNVPPLGSWFTSVADGKTSVGFHLRVPADATPAVLDAAIQAVAEAADDLELSSVGTDEN